MNVLLVDDEMDVLEGITDALDFDSLGIESVYLAQSAAHAREILLSRNVDIMVTDIEMPGESGLDLLQWVRDSGLDTVTLFGTSYAHFPSAHKALKMHSFDYFLKPIAYSALQERLAAAVKEAERIHSLKSHSRYWQNGLPDNKKLFWASLITGEVRSEKDILREEEKRGLSYSSEDRFLLCLFVPLHEEEDTAAWKRYASKNIREEIFASGNLLPEASVPVEGNRWCLIFQQHLDFSEEVFRSLFMEFSSQVTKCLSSWINCYYQADCPLTEIRGSFLDVEDISSDDVTSFNKIYTLKDYQKKDIPYFLPQIREWELLLLSGKADDLVAETHAHLDRQAARGELNMPYIKAMRIDMMQMIHTVLKQRQISAYDLFSDERFDRLRERSLLSLLDMKRYLEYIVRTASDYMNFTSESQSVVGRVKEYINSHLSEEITRNSMAKIVYLNSDYLARLFKKETGQSLGAYLQDRRIHEAKKLLVQTNIQVNEIAQRVGYDNFSYFSHTFREKTGVTPNEYRKNMNCL